jgi:hypothetical protein
MDDVNLKITNQPTNRKEKQVLENLSTVLQIFQTLRAFYDIRWLMSVRVINSIILGTVYPFTFAVHKATNLCVWEKSCYLLYCNRVTYKSLTCK